MFSRAAWSYVKHIGLVLLGNVEFGGAKCCVIGINNMF